MADVLDIAMQRLGVTDPQQQAFIRALNRAEASGKTATVNGGIIYGKPIVSGMHKGDRAMGPLQLMPKTFQGVVQNSGLKLDPSNNQDLATAGVWLAMDNLRMAKEDFAKAAAAHLGGPAAMNRVAKDATTGDNTADYAKRVLGYMGKGGTQNTAPSVNLAAATQAGGGNPVAAVMQAQQAGLIPTDVDSAGYVQTTQTPDPNNPKWLQELQNITAATPDRNLAWVTGTADTALAELPQLQLDEDKLAGDVMRAQDQRLAKAFGGPEPINIKLPTSVDKYIENLLES